MLYAVLKSHAGRQCGIDRNGSLEFDRNRIGLMLLPEAEATVAKFGGVVLSDQRLFSADFQEDENND